MPRVIFNDTKGLYQKSGSSVHIDGDMMIQKFDCQNAVLCQEHDGTTAVATNGGHNVIRFACGNTLYKHLIQDHSTANNIPQVAATGLNISSDTDVGDGHEFVGAHVTNKGVLNKNHFIVGTSPEFYIKATIKNATVANINRLFVGFRLQAAHAATIAASNTFAGVGLDEADYKIFTTLDTTAKTTDISETNATNGDSSVLEVRISANGNVRAFVNGTEYTSEIVAADVQVMTAGDVLVPSIHYVQKTGANVQTLEALEFGLRETKAS